MAKKSSNIIVDRIIKLLSVIIAICGFPFSWLLHKDVAISIFHIFKYDLSGMFFNVIVLFINYLIVFYLLNKIRKIVFVREENIK